MNSLGIGIFVVSMILYFVTKKKFIFLFSSGVGLGTLISWIAIQLAENAVLECWSFS